MHDSIGHDFGVLNGQIEALNARIEALKKQLIDREEDNAYVRKALADANKEIVILRSKIGQLGG